MVPFPRPSKKYQSSDHSTHTHTHWSVKSFWRAVGTFPFLRSTVLSQSISIYCSTNRLFFLLSRVWTPACTTPFWRTLGISWLTRRRASSRSADAWIARPFGNTLWSYKPRIVRWKDLPWQLLPSSKSISLMSTTFHRFFIRPPTMLRWAVIVIHLMKITTCGLVHKHIRVGDKSGWRNCQGNWKVKSDLLNWQLCTHILDTLLGNGFPKGSLNVIFHLIFHWRLWEIYGLL